MLKMDATTEAAGTSNQEIECVDRPPASIRMAGPWDVHAIRKHFLFPAAGRDRHQPRGRRASFWNGNATSLDPHHFETGETRDHAFKSMEKT